MASRDVNTNYTLPEFQKRALLGYYRVQLFYFVQVQICRRSKRFLCCKQFMVYSCTNVQHKPNLTINISENRLSMGLHRLCKTETCINLNISFIVQFPRPNVCDRVLSFTNHSFSNLPGSLPLVGNLLGSLPLVIIVTLSPQCCI